MAEGPRVTVVIPTWNRASLLAEAIESVLSQSYRDLEVIVCDDGSTDDTSIRVNEFGAPVRYLRLEHTGNPGCPRNFGIDAARGELVAFLDDDDLWDTDKLARQVELLDRDALDLVYTDRRILFSEGSAPELAVSPSPVSPDRLLDIVLAGHFPCVCTLLVRRELLCRTNGFDETMRTGEDLELLLRLSSIARAGRVPEPLVLVRRQPESVSEQNGLLAYRNAIMVLERSLAADGQLPSQRRICRVTLARLNAGLATVLMDRGHAMPAVRAALRALRYAPGSRAVWAALARSARSCFGASAKS